MILGIIPARGGSKGIKDKNIYPLCGKPMIEYTIQAAEKSMLDDWFVFTDKYTEYKTYGIIRPSKMSKGKKEDIFTWLPYAIEQYELMFDKCVDAIMLLQPTSPLRTVNDIDGAIECFNDNQLIESDSLYSGYLLRLKTKDKRFNKATDKAHFQRNGAIFITRRDLLNKGKLWSDNVIEYVMPSYRSVDVDDMDDVFIAGSILKNGGLHGYS